MNWETLNLIDLVLVVIVLLSVINGWRRGFILGVLDLLGWALVLFAGLRFYQPLARWLGSHVSLWSQVWDRPFAFILIAVLVTMAVQMLGKVLLGRVSKDTREGSLNRALGVLPGLANGLITAALVAAFMLAIPLNEGLRERARKVQSQTVWPSTLNDWRLNFTPSLPKRSLKR